MKLSDVVSHSGLAFYAEVALVLFFIVFVIVVVRTFRPSRRKGFEAQGRLPLEPDSTDRSEPQTPEHG
jgi:cbb3-type cytochrome oxidase subunit 3